MNNYRWIVYYYTPMPGETGFTLRRVTSLKAAREGLVEFEQNSGFYDGCSGSLYPYTEENWADAEEFATVGCPFDYPSLLVEHGPRGGVVLTNC